MKLKILTSCASLDFAYTEGDIVDVKTVIAKDLIKAGYAAAFKKAVSETRKAKVTADADAG